MLLDEKTKKRIRFYENLSGISFFVGLLLITVASAIPNVVGIFIAILSATILMISFFASEKRSKIISDFYSKESDK